MKSCKVVRLFIRLIPGRTRTSLVLCEDGAAAAISGQADRWPLLVMEITYNIISQLVGDIITLAEIKRLSFLNP